ncbi:mandelate racemase/muconate lactonizing enzyme family protein [Halolamina rubra]|uniref:mandelate racemase/muconate lactonizing enzyme family protein n=1 Tax=Halolamina rubra TaxID=1380430 RepID=UPI000679A0DF|nr:enolase C-terminal domain-like protein [Halolamina rubra]
MITSVDVVSREIPYADAFPTSYDDQSPTQHVFVRVRAGEETGYGEGSALKWFTGDTAATMAAIVRSEFVPAIEGKPVDEALGDCRALANRLPGNPGASSAVEMALLDLRAKQLEVPVRTLLGQARRDSIPLAFASGALPPETVASNAVDAFDAGFRTFKIKVTPDLETSVARINAVTRVLAERADPNDVFVRADANTGWESYERATSAIDRIERQAYVEYYEQPVAADAIGDLRALRTNRGVPVFADEAVHGVDEVRELTREPAAVSGVCAKLAKAGSLLEIVRMGELAADAGLPVTLISAFETSLGVAANLHVASVLPSLSSAAELGANLIAEDPVDRSIERAADTPVPEGPGLGVELDDALFD